MPVSEIALALVLNALLAAGVYFGFYTGIAWVAYLTTGFIWLMLVFYVSAALQPNAEIAARVRPETPVGFWATRIYDVALTVALVAAAAHVTATAYATSCFVSYWIYERRRRFANES